MEQHMEKAHSDADLLAKDAVISLYEKDLRISAVQKAFSTGAFGLAKNRKLVPTRWSITAVDDTIGKHLIEEIKGNPVVDCYHVYEYGAMSNRFFVLFMPTTWQYEFLEAFVRVFGSEEMLFADYEGGGGRKTYAGMGGCYYSARLAAAEKLKQMKKQAGVIVFRESYRGYVPLGVWLIREHVRSALKSEPKKFPDFSSAMNYVQPRLVLPFYRYAKESRVIKEQKRATSKTPAA